MQKHLNRQGRYIGIIAAITVMSTIIQSRVLHSASAYANIVNRGRDIITSVPETSGMPSHLTVVSANIALPENILAGLPAGIEVLNDADIRILPSIQLPKGYQTWKRILLARRHQVRFTTTLSGTRRRTYHLISRSTAPISTRAWEQSGNPSGARPRIHLETTVPYVEMDAAEQSLSLGVASNCGLYGPSSSSYAYAKRLDQPGDFLLASKDGVACTFTRPIAAGTYIVSFRVSARHQRNASLCVWMNATGSCSFETRLLTRHRTEMRSYLVTTSSASSIYLYARSDDSDPVVTEFEDFEIVQLHGRMKLPILLGIPSSYQARKQ